MTLNQLETLTEDELALALYIVNVIEPLDIPKMQFEPRQLTWFRHEALVEKLVRAFPKLLPEGHPIFVSLMEKLGVKGEIRKPEPPQTEATSSICPPPQNEKPNSPESSTSTETELPNTSSNSP
jgi:hypothetical protein